jgi:hypothetical protein
MSFLLGATTQRVRLFKPEDEKPEKTDWAKYGLQPPASTIEFGAGRDKESLSISSKNAFDGSFYLRQKDELLVGDTGFAQLNARSSRAFRSRLLWREKGPVEKAEVELEKEKYAIAKKDGAWSLEPKPSYPVDAAKIEAWLDRVQEFKPGEIAADSADEDQKRAFLLLVPSAKIRLNGDWLLTIGQDRAQDVFLYTNRKPTVFKSSVPVLAQIRVPASFFRDGRKPFEFPVEQARTIEIHDGKTVSTLKKGEKGWADEAVSFMQALKGLEAREFVAPKKSGIDTPQVLVKDESGKVLLSLAWGDDYAAREPYNSGAPLRYARTNLDKDVMGLPKDKLQALLATVKPEKAEPK